ncbi:MAG: hypothetical protein ABI759_13715 [Candidatus Solibacter sp.]
MNVDTELEVWRQQWQSGPTVPLDLRRKVERQSRFMKIALLGDILVTITIGGAAAGWAVRSPQPEIVLLAVATWVYIAIAWTFSLTVNRGNWSPSAQDVAVFVDLSVRRCRGRLAAVWFAAGLFLFQIVFVLSWVYRYSPQHRVPVLRWLFFGSVPIDIVWLCTAVFFSFLIWYRRRKLAELVSLLSLREQMTDAASGIGNKPAGG